VGTLAPTPTLGLVLPDPGTNQPFSTAVQNGWFQGIDTAVGADRTRITAVEKLTLPGAPSGILGVIPAGTTAQRDTFYGTPGDATARVALASKYARWFNTDKGYEQQYFAQFDDLGVGSAPAKKVFGWRPSIANGRVPVSVFTVTGSTPANVKKYGSTLELSGAVSTISMDGVFTTDFDDYEIEVEFTGASSTIDVSFQFRAAGVAQASGVYTRSRVFGSGPTASASTDSGFSFANLLTGTATEGGFYTLRVTNPASTDWKRMTSVGGSGTLALAASAVAKLNTSCDGFSLIGGGGGTLSGGSTVRVYGISNGK
jgi:hypothetical protein